MDRRPGQRKESFDDESNVDLIHNIRKMIRTDFGGKDHVEWVRQTLERHNVHPSDRAANAILDVLRKQVEACRKRVGPRLDELIKRVGVEPEIENI